MFPSVPNHRRSSAECVPAGRCALCHEPGCCLAGVLVLKVTETVELSRGEKRMRGGRKAGREEGRAALSSRRSFSKCTWGPHLWAAAALSPVEAQGSEDIGIQPSL